MELFRLFGSVIIDDKDAIESLKKVDKKTNEVSDSSSKAFEKIGNAAKVAGALIATGLTAVIVSGVKSTMEAENAAAQLEAVLKSTGGASGMTKDSLIALGDELEKTTKFTSESVQSAESLLLTFTNIGEKVFPQATKTAADMAAALGTDMSGQAIALGKALNDPIAGISALSRVGVTFTQEQKDQITAMVEAGDVAGAQTVILNELNKEFGGSAEAAGKTLSGQLEIAKNAFGSVTESVVTGLMPMLTNFVNFINNNMPAIQEFVNNALVTFGDAIEFITNNLNIIIPILAAVLGGIVAYQIISTISALMAVWTTITAGQSGAMAILNAVMAANPIMLIVIAIAALIAIGVALIMNWDKISESAAKLWEKIKSVFGKVGEFFKGVWDTVVEMFTKIGTTVGDAIGNAFKTVVNAIINFAEEKINGFISAINLAIGLINMIPGVNIGLLKPLDIPEMEAGGVLKKGQVGFLEGNGDEAVMPLSKNTEWIDTLASKINKSGGSGSDMAEIKYLLMQLVEAFNVGFDLDLDKKEFGRLVKKYV